CRAAAVLTSRTRWESWRAEGLSEGQVARWLEAAAGQAAEAGHDATGRLRTVHDWLAAQSASGPAGSPPMGTSLFGSAWTEWQPRAGDPGADSFAYVRTGAVTGCGLAVAAAFVAGVWCLRRAAGKVRTGLLLTWLTAGGLAVLWLPDSLRLAGWLPLAAGSAVAAWSWVRLPAPSAKAPARAAAALVLLGVAAALGGAAGRPPWVVFVIGRPADAPDRQAVLAPPELLKGQA